MIGRASCGAETAHFFDAEFLEPSGVEKGLGFLIEKGLICRAATFGNKEEFVGITLGGVEINLGRQIGMGIDFLVHA